MKVINNTKNTVYVEDIDIYLPYEKNKVIDINNEDLKRSKCLRGFIINGMLEIVEYNPEERIENSIAFLSKKYSKKHYTTEQTTEPENNDVVSISPLDKVSDEIEVKIHGIFLDAGGYAKVNRNIALKLHEAGVKVRVDPKRSVNQLTEADLEPIVRLQKTQISRNHILIDSIIPSFAEMSSGRYKVLYTTIESYSVPKQFIDCCQMYDEIWTTSRWSADILREVVDKPIYPVVTGVDETHYKEEGPKIDLKPNVKDFVFVSVFGWNYRKGYDVLLKAYLDEFSAEDNVTLLLVSRYQSGTSKFHKNKIKEDIDEIMKDFPNKDLPHIVRYSDVISENDMPSLYRSCNCFILSSRGEGGCLPPLEASMCGLPVIMTNCSGQQGYLRQDNSFMLEIDRIAESVPGQFKIHYWDKQKFPLLTSQKVHDDLKGLMRQVVDNPQEAKKRNKRLQKLILEEFTWNNTANQAISRLKLIHEKIRER